jgi:hypothetical protein
MRAMTIGISQSANERDCKDTYLSNVELNINQIFKWRNYDELQQLKGIVGEITEKRRLLAGVINPTEIQQDLMKQEKLLEKRVHLIFPKIRRWSNVTTLLSIPVALAGIGTGSPLFTISGASLAGASQLLVAATNLLSSKYSWVSFRNKSIVSPDK